ncbi:MAG: glycosyltransferase family 4 protein [Chloroflexi bacterium]|nr:glycosyltransferase family 4 protein [Chloroflexota bacterium]
MTRVLYLYNIDTTFVQIDADILSRRYDVTSIHIQRRTPSLLRQMWQETKDVDLVVAWFASWHSWPAFISARLRSVPRLLFTSGYDLANEPEIGYGLRRGGLPRLISGQVFRLASLAIVPSQFSFDQVLKNTPVQSGNVCLVPHGIPDTPSFAEARNKEPIAFTVGTLDRISVSRKGIRMFVQSAAHLPQTRFVVVGKARDSTIDELKRIATPNVEFTGFMPDAALVDLRRRAKVYVQASYHEGFGMAVAESMLAQCIPVVTRKGALPEVVGDTGLYINSHTPAGIAKAIKSALDVDSTRGNQARQRVLDHFSLEQRAAQIYPLVDSLLSKPR